MANTNLEMTIKYKWWFIPIAIPVALLKIRIPYRIVKAGTEFSVNGRKV